VTRALLILALLLTFGEVSGLLDAALGDDCAVSCAARGDDGCALCPCCQQGRLACPELPAFPEPALVCERVELTPARAEPPAPLARIFHPPRSAAR
jgi:hypothetical protein